MAKVTGILMVVVVVMMAAALSVVSASDESTRQYGDGSKLWGIVDQTTANNGGGKFAFGNSSDEQPEMTLAVAGNNDNLFSAFQNEAEPQSSRFGSTLMSGYEAGEQAQWLQHYWNTWLWGR